MKTVEQFLREIAPELYEGDVGFYDPLAEVESGREYDFEDEWEGD